MGEKGRWRWDRDERGAEDAARSLVTGAFVFRWVWLIWMAVLAVAGWNDFRRPTLVVISLSIAIVWTALLTARRDSLNVIVLAADLAVCLWLIAASAYVVGEGEVVSGRPFFATGYPLSAPLLWGALRGPVAGGVTAAVLGLGHLATRPLNGVPLDVLTPGQVQNVTGAMLNYLVAGVAVGLVARLLWRSSEAVRQANEEVVRQREHSARLAERESLGRTIHDSVLQALALVNKRGKELAGLPAVPPADVARLAELAGDQEAQLRTLISRPPDSPPRGRLSLRDALEDAAAEVEDVAVSVSCVGPLWFPSQAVREVAAAAKQALTNVARHAHTKSAAVFAEEEEGAVVVSIRDDGAGFEYDEERLRVEGKVGIIKSIKGRVEELGGSVQIITSPGRGTEIELRLPMSTSP